MKNKKLGVSLNTSEKKAVKGGGGPCVGYRQACFRTNCCSGMACYSVNGLNSGAGICLTWEELA